MYLFFVVALFTVCHSYVLNDVHYRSINGSGFVLLDEMDLSELSDEEIAMLRFSLIYPGTKWCGPGDTAENYEDLGVAEAEDRCCRQHDYCPDTIVSGETKHNLTNDSYYTKLSCECDEIFRQCLRQAASVNSKTIGTVYFNVIGTQCFRRDYPVTGCLKKGGWLLSKCVEYSYDKKGKKLHQWFDVPNYHD
ncbi:phospholipase A2-like [Aricia agestis]|uniref:phospholipase A2-like n=1 Tax=Aricia agestis TaxID=91739 RepID=UPI001C2022D0|nr:phospholipase A2-like [Aricia agestis]